MDTVSKIPSSSLLEERLSALQLQIPDYRIVDQVDGLNARGRWAAALGSVNHPSRDPDGHDLMLFAMLVVIDLDEHIVRMANPLPSGNFRITTLYRYLAMAMRDPVRGQPARPEQLVFPQENLAALYRPLLLRVDVPYKIQDTTGFDAVFDAILGDLA